MLLSPTFQKENNAVDSQPRVVNYSETRTPLSAPQTPLEPEKQPTVVNPQNIVNLKNENEVGGKDEGVPKENTINLKDLPIE